MEGLNKPRCFVLALFYLFFCQQSGQAFASGDYKPHILMIIADDEGYADIGYNAEEAIAADVAPLYTPNMDRLASEGIKLSEFYVQPACSPSRMALLSGRYPLRYGFGAQFPIGYSPRALPDRGGMPLSEVTLAQKLKDQGYSTNLIGKWHIGMNSTKALPINRGFDSFVGNLGSQLDYTTKLLGVGGTFESLPLFFPVEFRDVSYDLHRETRSGDKVEIDIVVDQETYASDFVTKEAVNIIQKHNTDDPLFLMLAYQAPHSPLQAKQEDIEACKNTGATFKGSRDIFCGMVHSIDRGIGEIERALMARSMLDDTVIIYFSDNGSDEKEEGGSNGRLQGVKSTLFNGAMKVPSWINIGPKVKASRNIAIGESAYRGAVVNKMRHVVDIHSAVLDMAQSPQTSNLDGIRAPWEAILSNNITRSELVLAAGNVIVSEGPFKTKIYNGSRCIIIDDFKYIEKPSAAFDDTIHLYNIKEDPYEKTNLLEKNPSSVAAVVENMKQRLDFWDSQREVEFPYLGSTGAILSILEVPIKHISALSGGGIVRIPNKCTLPDDLEPCDFDCTSLVESFNTCPVSFERQTMNEVPRQLNTPVDSTALVTDNILLLFALTIVVSLLILRVRQ